jgi:hypothetical protein
VSVLAIAIIGFAVIFLISLTCNVVREYRKQRRLREEHAGAIDEG